MRLFVYGSLMSGMDAEKYMSGAKLISKDCITADKMSMYIHEGYPFVFNGRSKYEIKGEMYEITSGELKKLSEFEGDFYYLTVTDVVYGESVVSAYVFMGRGHFFGMEEVENGDYRKFCGYKR